MSLAEERYWTALIIAALLQSVLASARGETAHASVRNARSGGFTRRPSTNSAPAGGGGARGRVDGGGAGARARPPAVPPPRGGRGRRGAPPSPSASRPTGA